MEVVVHAVGVGDVDVEGVVVMAAAEGGEYDVKCALGVVAVHSVGRNNEVGWDIKRNGG